MKPRDAVNIACLESTWYAGPGEAVSVAPLLEIVARLHGTRFFHATCNTAEELRFHLKALPRRRRFRMLYLAAHGSPGHIKLADETRLTLDELAGIMGRRFSGWIIHFGSCGTLDLPAKELARFRERTGALLLVGYGKSIDWTESAALDLIIFDWLQHIDDKGDLWRVLSRYPDLIRLTGLIVYPRAARRVKE